MKNILGFLSLALVATTLVCGVKWYQATRDEYLAQPENASIIAKLGKAKTRYCTTRLPYETDKEWNRIRHEYACTDFMSDVRDGLVDPFSTVRQRSQFRETLRESLFLLNSTYKEREIISHFRKGNHQLDEGIERLKTLNAKSMGVSRL